MESAKLYNTLSGIVAGGHTEIRDEDGKKTLYLVSKSGEAERALCDVDFEEGTFYVDPNYFTDNLGNGLPLEETEKTLTERYGFTKK